MKSTSHNSRKRTHTYPEQSPWALAVGEVAARPGQSKTVDMQMPTPSGIGDTIIGVTEGEPVNVNGSFDSIVDGLVFSGSIDAPVHAECTRCLTPINRSWAMDVTAFFPFESATTAANQPRGKETSKGEYDIIADEDESEDVYPLSADGEYADFEALLRDTLVEGLPLQPLCKPDCQGLCPQCGVNLNDNPTHHHDQVDDRFSGLAALKQQLEQQEHNAENNK